MDKTTMDTKLWKYTLSAITFIAALGAGSVSLASIQYGFTNITNNGNQDLSSQLTVDVYDKAEAESTFSISLGTANILFVFANDVGITSSVAQIYFDDEAGTNAVLSQLGIWDADNNTNLGGNVDYSPGGAPPVLPGGNTVVPPFVVSVMASADNPAPQNGINGSNDLLGLSFVLANGHSYADAIAALNNGDLRVGMHVISIGTRGGSDSYVNTGGAVPEPTALVVWSLLVGLGVAMRRR